MSASGAWTASARPRTSTPRWCHGSVLARSSTTIAALPERSTSRNFLRGADRAAAHLDRVLLEVEREADGHHVGRPVGAHRGDAGQAAAAGRARQVLALGGGEAAHAVASVS
jgi:hypothetical protein